MRNYGAPPSPTRALAEFAAELSYADLNDRTRHSVRRHCLDTLGAAIAGAHGAASKVAQRTLASVIAPGKIPVPGTQARWDRLAAIYIMGASAHGLEVDDGYRAGSVHPGAVVIPAALLAGYGTGVNGQAVVTAIAIGYELVTRIAEAAHPASRIRGFHNTPIAGVFGAAAAAGSIFDLDARQMEHALGIAASSAGGLFAFLQGGGEIKRLHPGTAAREGVFAALLAREGMTAPTGVLEIKDGFFQAYGDGLHDDELTAGLGNSFNVTRCYMKPYSCCRHIHPALDAVRQIVDAGVDAAEIERIDSGTYRIAAHHADGNWQEMASAQLSYQYTTAVAALRGGVALKDFDDASLSDPTINALCSRVHVRVDEGCEADYPRLRSARVTVTTRDGRCHEAYVDEPLGSARYPLSDSSVVEKYVALTEPVLGGEAENVARTVWSLDGLSSIDTLLDATAAQQ